jgi:hypothetical protein
MHALVTCMLAKHCYLCTLQIVVEGRLQRYIELRNLQEATSHVRHWELHAKAVPWSQVIKAGFYEAHFALKIWGQGTALTCSSMVHVSALANCVHAKP